MTKCDADLCRFRVRRIVVRVCEAPFRMEDLSIHLPHYIGLAASGYLGA